MKSDSRWPSDSCQYSAVHNAYHTSLHSDTICPWGFSCVQYIRLNSGIYLKANWEPWKQQTDVSCAQTHRDRASRATTSLTNRAWLHGTDVPLLWAREALTLTNSYMFWFSPWTSCWIDCILSWSCCAWLKARSQYSLRITGKLIPE